MNRCIMIVLVLSLSITMLSCSSSHSERLDYWEIANNNGSGDNDNPSGNAGDSDTPGNPEDQEGNAADDSDGQIPNSNDSDITPYCGDGIVTGDELCEPGNSKACVELDPVLYKGGSASCQSDCLSYNIATCEKFTWDMLATGEHHSCAIKNGALFCWGYNEYGQVGNGTTIDAVFPVRIGNATDWKQISLGSNHSCGIRNTTIYCWGDNSNGQLGISKGTSYLTTPEHIYDMDYGDGWSAVAATGDTTYSINNGELYYWGSSVFSPVPMSVGSGWKSLAQGNASVICGIKGSVLHCWGNNYYGQLGNGTTLHSKDPVQVGTDSGWKMAAIGATHTCGIRNGELYCWGKNNKGQLGNGTADDSTSPVRIGQSSEWQWVTAGNNYTCALQRQELYCWGEKRLGNQGSGLPSYLTKPTRIGTASNWTAVSGINRHTCGIENGELFCWGYNRNGQVGIGIFADKSKPVRIGEETGWTAPAIGTRHACALKNKKLFCWGQDTSDIQQSPQALGESSGWTYLAHGSRHLCSIGGAKLYCWGANESGQIGDGTIGVTYDAPRHIGGYESGWTKITLGYDHSCGIKKKQIYCWGGNRKGQLGTGESGVSENKAVPVPVGSETDWSHLAAGWFFTCGIRNTELYCWGDNQTGQLGVGESGEGNMRITPTRVGTDSGWADISAGNRYACGIKNTELYCWGDNILHFFGSSDEPDSRADEPYPTRVGTDTGWQSVKLGTDHACGIREGALYCWGLNAFGQLGTGAYRDAIEKTLPVQVGTDTDWTEIAAGEWFTCGTKLSGELFCWGNNWYGQLGDETAWFDEPQKIN